MRGHPTAATRGYLGSPDGDDALSQRSGAVCGHSRLQRTPAATKFSHVKMICLFVASTADAPACASGRRCAIVRSKRATASPFWDVRI